MYQTQKAKGLALAASLAQRTNVLNHLSIAHHVINAADAFTLKDLSDYLDNYYSKIMVRPAPRRPRHGFVESRSVSRDHFNIEFPLIQAQVVAAEPDAEIIFMPFIEAEYNYILSSSGLTIGEGFDGATAGKDVAFIPVACDLKSYLETITPNDLAKRYGVAAEEDTYIEAVSREQQLFFTQVRAGPYVAASRDYIPRELTVSEVIEVDTDDLLEWEARAAALAGRNGLAAQGASRTGVAIYHPGGAVTSHFGVHCAINGLAYLTTWRPEAGQTLTPTTSESWGAAEYERVARLVEAYSDMHITERAEATEALIVSVATLHAMTSLLASRDESALRLVAFTLAFLPKLFTTMAAGESRHALHKITNLSDDIIVELLPFVASEHNRESVYEHTLYERLSAMPDILARCHALFSTPHWNGGYGGKRWAECTDATIDFLDNVLRFTASHSEENFKAALSSLNIAVNKAHNNGWWLNKFIDHSIMDILSQAPVLGLAKPLAYQLATQPAPGTRIGHFPNARGYADGYLNLLAEQDDQEQSGESLLGPYPHLIRKGRLMQFTPHAHLQIPGNFKNNNRDWGISADISDDTDGERELLRILNLAYAQSHKVGSQNSGSAREYSLLHVSLRKGWLIFMLHSSAPELLSYSVSKNRLCLRVPLYQIPSFMHLKEIL